jgi:hypothetical protein
MQIAVVATSRKLAVLCWHLVVDGKDYACGRPSLLAQKLRALELPAGMPSRRGQRGSTHAYNLKEVRAREHALSEQAELAYRQLVADWQAKAPARRTGTGAATGDSEAVKRQSCAAGFPSPRPALSSNQRQSPDRRRPSKRAKSANPLPRVATSCRKNFIGMSGSTVRVSQRARPPPTHAVPRRQQRPSPRGGAAQQTQ